MVYENMIAQMFTALGRKLYYYSRYSEEKHRNNVEVDFLPSSGSRTGFKMFPIEVKSSKNYSAVSLGRFGELYPKRIAESFIVHPKPLVQEEGLTRIPPYMVFCASGDGAYGGGAAGVGDAGAGGGDAGAGAAPGEASSESVSTGADSSAASAVAGVAFAEPDEFQALADAGELPVLDVRTKAKFDMFEMPWPAENVPLVQLAARADEVPAADGLLLVASNDDESLRAAGPEHRELALEPWRDRRGRNLRRRKRFGVDKTNQSCKNNQSRKFDQREA